MRPGAACLPERDIRGCDGPTDGRAHCIGART
jgi:hypothetical protein